MKAVKKTGLVPVLIGKRVTGVMPALAIEGVAAGTMQLVAIPDGIETVPVGSLGPVPDAIVTEVVVNALDGLIDIPSDWVSLHHLKLVKLARAIVDGDLPRIDNKQPVVVAREIIQAEVERRAGLDVDAGDSPSITS